MEYTAQFTYDCLWRVDGEKRVCTGGHESDGYPWSCDTCVYCNICHDSMKWDASAWFAD